MPTLLNIHANAPSTTSNCAQCHGANVVAGFAIPAANFSIVGPPSNHMPITTACEVCHVGPGSSVTTTPVGNGAKFSNSRMSHTGITNKCDTCHGPSITGSSFAGVSRIVVMPPTSPVGASAHIPSSTTCEACHLGTTPAGLILASTTKPAPGTLFATPASRQRLRSAPPGSGHSVGGRSTARWPASRRLRFRRSRGGQADTIGPV